MKTVLLSMALLFTLNSAWSHNNPTNNNTTPVGATYTFTGYGPWTDPNNWTPARITPAPTDIIIFDGSSTIVNNVPTQTIGQLIIRSAYVTMIPASFNTLTITGDTGEDLDISGGLIFIRLAAVGLSIKLSPGATGSISGLVVFSNGPHRILASDADAIRFHNGSYCIADTGFVGAPFGSLPVTGAANSVIFESGSTYIHEAGAPPFGANPPASIVIFQPGSVYRVTGTGVTPSFAGRVYGDVQFQGTGPWTITGSEAMSMDNLSMWSGTATINMPGNPGHSIRGEIYVEGGATLNFDPASPSTINLNGATRQIIEHDGIINSYPNQTFVLNNPEGVIVDDDVTILGDLIITQGNFEIGPHNLIIGNTITGSAAGYVKTSDVGVLTVNNIGATGKLLPIGNKTYNPLTIANGSGFDWSARVQDTISNAAAPLDSNKAVNRTWHISPSGTVVSGPNITFGFNDADDSQLFKPAAYSADPARVAQFWHYGPAWTVAGNPATMTPAEGPQSITLSGYTSYSPFVIAKISGVLPVKFTNLRAYQQDKGIRIDWSNLSESNMIDYKVERSANGIDFTSLATVVANRNDGSEASYSYFDATPFDGNNYYRIQAREATGGKLNSMVVRVSTKAGAAITIYPNPVNGNQVFFQASGLRKGKYTINIFNSAGQQVLNRTIQHAGGNLSEAIQLPAEIKAGLYSLVITGEEMNSARSFIVQ